MPGRHASGRRTTRWHPLLVGVVLIGVVCAGVGFLVFGPPDANRACSGTTPLRIGAAPRIQPLLGKIANRINEREVEADGGCLEVRVDVADTERTRQQLEAGKKGDLPDLWVPESWDWVNAKGLTTDQILPMSSVAATPLVVAAPTDRAAELQKPTSWVDLARSHPMSLSDPENSATSYAALLAILRSMPGPIIQPKDRDELARIIVDLDRRRTADITTALTKVSRGQVPDPVIATEQDLVAYQRATPGAKLAAAVPNGPTSILDFPLVALNTSTAKTTLNREAYPRIVSELNRPEGRKLLARYGFRPSAKLSAAPSAPEEGRAPAKLDLLLSKGGDIDEPLRSWAATTADTRMLAVADVSGSMQESAGTQTRLQLTQEAIRTAFGYFQSTDAFGLWTFSQNLAGPGRDYQEQAGVDALDPAHHAAAVQAIDALDDRAVGGTGLYDTALAAYTSAVEGYDANRRNYVVLFTDGKNEDDGLTLPDLTARLTERARDDRPVRMLVVGIGPEVDSAELGKIAGAVDGEAYTADDPADMKRIMINALVGRTD